MQLSHSRKRHLLLVDLVTTLFFAGVALWLVWKLIAAVTALAAI